MNFTDTSKSIFSNKYKKEAAVKYAQSVHESGSILNQ